MRSESTIAPGWWDYTTLDPALLKDAAILTPRHLAGLGRPGFDIRFYDTLEDFYHHSERAYLGERQRVPRPVERD